MFVSLYVLMKNDVSSLGLQNENKDKKKKKKKNDNTKKIILSTRLNPGQGTPA